MLGAVAGLLGVSQLAGLHWAEDLLLLCVDLFLLKVQSVEG